MRAERRAFWGDQKGFTGLEAAIVLTAFVVVAAVFSYVVLNAGFFTAQKSEEVIHTGVEQATSSVELVGDVIAHGDGTNVTNVTLTLGLTAGKSPIDLKVGRTVISYTDKNQYVANTTRDLSWVGEEVTQDTVLESGEKAQIVVDLSGLTTQLTKNTRFTIEVKPPEGAVLTIERTTPPAIDTVMNLH
ncbi:MAG: flagellin [Methanophagales archaeon ANME-1-THS]|nr:MAG: flagellin [Methanophagales archaeon ANME-1-THS]